MNKDLEQKLIKKHPYLFRDVYGDPKTTCMSFGIECQDGWYDLIDMSLQKISFYVKERSDRFLRDKEFNDALIEAYYGNDEIFLNKFPYHNLAKCKSDGMKEVKQPYNPYLVQIKEKYGTLRIYLSEYEEYVDGILDLAEGMSFRTCDICGNKGSANSGGWIRVRCKEHENN